MKLGLAAVRVVVGLLFFGHGAQKLFGWFGGHGLEATGGFFEQIGLKPGRRTALAAGASEAGGGALLALGFLTPLASSALIGVMTQAIRTVHAPKGVWNQNGGFEYNAVLIAAAFAVTDVGPGEWSLDHALGLNLKGPAWALGALAAGVAGPSLLMRGGEEETAPVAAGDSSEQTAPTPAGATA
jgi:putative oxidoreductase